MEAIITMTGWVGSEVEHRTHEPSNLSTASFRLGCTPRVNRQGSWSDAPTTWLTVTTYRTLADHVSASLGKGDPVVVSGRLRTQVWKGKVDNEVHERLVLEATTVGHDLTRGTSVFRKAERPNVDPATFEAEVGETISAVEQPGQDAAEEAGRELETVR